MLKKKVVSNGWAASGKRLEVMTPLTPLIRPCTVQKPKNAEAINTSDMKL